MGWKLGFHPVFILVLFSVSAFGLDVQSLNHGAIVVAPDAAPAEGYAAAEFRALFDSATGIDLPIVTTTRRGGSNVYIGNAAAGMSGDTDDMGDETFAIHITDDGIAIAGGSPRGTLYGVYHFAEQFLGVRFLTAEHTYVPANKHLVFPHTEVTFTPPFAYRWVFSSEVNDHPAFMARLRNNGLDLGETYGGGSARPLVSHSLGYQVPVTEYGHDHPEYYAELDGVRVLEIPDAPQSEPQVDPLNRDLPAIVADAVRRERDDHPGRAVFSVSPNDSPYHCTCAACSALIRREGAAIAPHLTLVNAVAGLLPTARIGTLAYWNLRTPPKSLRPAPNVDIQYCTFEATGYRPLADPQSVANGPVYRDLLDWRAATPNLYVWHYITNLRHVDLPYPNIESLGANIRLFRDVGVKGLFLQANGRCEAGEWADMKAYVASRLMWEPDLDAAALADEFITLHYGPAAEPIRRAMLELTDTLYQSGREPDCWSTARECGYTAENAAAYYGAVQTAKSIADDSLYAPRIDKLLLGAEKAVLATSGHIQFRADRMGWVAPPSIQNLLSTYDARAERLGMNRDHEFGPRRFFVDAFGRAMEGTPSAVVSQGDWHVCALPAVSGQLISLIHAPTGVEWLDPDGAAGPGLPASRVEVSVSSGVSEFDVAPYAASVSSGECTLTGDGPGFRITQRIHGREDLEHLWRLVHNDPSPRPYRLTATMVLNGRTLHAGLQFRQAGEWAVMPSDGDLPPQADGVRIEGLPALIIAWTPGNIAGAHVHSAPGDPYVTIELVSASVMLHDGEIFETGCTFVVP